MNSSNAPTEENQQPNLSGVAFDSTGRGEEQSVSGPSTETRGVKRRPTGKLSTKSKWTQRRASKEGRGTVAQDTASSVAPGEQNDNIVAGLDEEEAAVNGGAMGLDNEAERVDVIGAVLDRSAVSDDEEAALDDDVAAGMDNEAVPVDGNEAVLDDEAAALDDDEASEGVEEAEPAEEHTTSWSLGISLVHGNRRPDLARMREQSAYGSVENRKNSGNPKKKWREPVTQGKGETKPIRGRTEILSRGAIREVASWKSTMTDCDVDYEAPYLTNFSMDSDQLPPFSLRLLLVCSQLLIYYQRFDNLSTQHLRACYEYCKQHSDELNETYRKKVFLEFVKAMKERRDGIDNDGDDDDNSPLDVKEVSKNNAADDSDDEEAMLEAMLENSDQFDDDYDDAECYDSDDDCGTEHRNKRTRIGK